jgi:hypothetical protein
MLRGFQAGIRSPARRRLTALGLLPSSLTNLKFRPSRGGGTGADRLTAVSGSDTTFAVSSAGPKSGAGGGSTWPIGTSRTVALDQRTPSVRRGAEHPENDAHEFAHQTAGTCRDRNKPRMKRSARMPRKSDTYGDWTLPVGTASIEIKIRCVLLGNPRGPPFAEVTHQRASAGTQSWTQTLSDVLR